jgi:hypothetical protein
MGKNNAIKNAYKWHYIENNMKLNAFCTKGKPKCHSLIIIFSRWVPL